MENLKNNKGAVLVKLILALVIWLSFSSKSEAVLARTLKLTKQDIADIKRIEDHLNSSKTVRARFLQLSSDGSYGEGIVHIQRPGKMRLEYDPPNPTLVIADGLNLFYIDQELNQATPMLLYFTPAELILRESISFLGKEVLVTGFKRSPGVLRISIVRAESPKEAQIMLVFSDTPLGLRKWVITDAQGIKTTVSLLGPEFGVKLDPKLFEYEMPNSFDILN